MEKDNIKLGHRIKTAREKMGMTQAEFAAKLEVYPTHLNRWEKGKVAPGWGILAEISKICNVSLDWLIIGNDDFEKEHNTFLNLNNCNNKDIEKIIYWLQNNPQDIILFLKIIKGKKEIKAAIEALQLLGLSTDRLTNS
ncbi:MAG: helix-turn-helix transcriptional regulator [Candidatus Wallbacteria bacterium]